MTRMLSKQLLTVFVLTMAAISAARAEVATIRLARQFGIAYLPLTIMEERGLLEKHATAAGLSVKAQWLRFSAGSGMNDALLSGNLDIAAGGVAPMLTIWSRTRSNLEVKGIAALTAMPLYLVTTNPKVRSIADFGPGDKIAVPAVKTSIQSVTLQMAALKLFGPGQQGRFDPMTVSMGHPDAQLAMLGGKSGISAHFGSSPFQEMELKDPSARKVLDSYEVLGGPHTFSVTWANAKFVRDNPKLTMAFLAALEESIAFIKTSPADAARVWTTTEKTTLSEAEAVTMITDPTTEWSTMPKRIMPYLAHMQSAGMIKDTTQDWRELFFDLIHAGGGN